MPTKPLDRLLFAQGGLCFFCNSDLPKADASVEHLVASANGGTNADDNCVVCCKAMNALLGSMSLKEKIRVVLNQKGRFKCPNGVQAAAAKRAPASDVELVMEDLSRRGEAKPKSVTKLTSTIHALFHKKLSEDKVAELVEQLIAKGFISITGTKVAYPA